MSKELERAKGILQEEKCTLVLIKEEYVHISHERGVKPLLSLLKSNEYKIGCSVADKVIGKAAAFLYELMEVKEVYAQVISEKALVVLEKANIAVAYDQCVPAIRNRTNTGFCPMETAVSEIDSAREAFQILEKKTAEILVK